MIRPRNIFRLRERAGRASRVIVDLNARISNAVGKKNARIENSTRASPKFYPTGAVQVNLPFPFGKRRMTVAADLTSNKGLSFSAPTKPPLFRQLSVRGRHLNLEHRRVNSKAAG